MADIKKRRSILLSTISSIEQSKANPMKKILFMRPHAPGPRFTPFGILYVAGHLKKHKYPAELKVLDLRSLDLTDEEIAQRIGEFSPDIIGLSCLSNESVFTHKLVEICRDTMPDATIVMGGPYGTGEWEYVLRDEKVDYCVVGEGEQTFLEFLQALDQGDDPVDVRGVAARDESGTAILKAPREFIRDLDALSFPAYEFIDLKEYSRKENSHLPAFDLSKTFTQMFTSRGCPYRCTFCHNIFGKKIRFRTPDNVLEEIDWLVKEHGVGEIHLEDDSFNIDMDRAKEICRKIIERKYPLRFAFPNGIRADHVDEELITLFKKMGVYSIGYGVESASETVRKRIHKNLNLEKLEEAIRLTAKHGIAVSGYFMIGFPNETEQEMEDSIQFACNSKLHIAVFSRVIPFPGTELYNEVLKEGFDYSRELFDRISFEKISINLSAVSDEKLEEKARSGLRRFYMNPGRLFRIFMVYPGKINLFLEGLRVAKKKLFHRI